MPPLSVVSVHQSQRHKVKRVIIVFIFGNNEMTSEAGDACVNSLDM